MNFDKTRGWRNEFDPDDVAAVAVVRNNEALKEPQPIPENILLRVGHRYSVCDKVTG